MTDVDLPRAGFWRRTAAVLLDCLIILVPLQVLVVLGFALMNGAVQGEFGFAIRSCIVSAATPELVARLQDAPAGTSVVTYCRTSLLGFDTAGALIATANVQDRTGSGSVMTTSVSKRYPVNGRLQFVSAVDLDIPAYLVLAVGVAWQWASRGRTLAGRIVRLRLIRRDADVITEGGIGWRAAAKRFVCIALTSMIILPAGLIAAGLLWGMSSYGLMRFDWLAWSILGLGAVAQVIVSILVLIDIVCRRDPIYDRWAKTAAVVG
jgi:hypothetical protein